MSFSESFVWGAATASYQIEGANAEDGRGPCVWDMLCRKPGAIWSGHNGDVACDHYHRYAEDVRLMKELGLKGYRFSISWPRILPEGECCVNAKGLDFYDRLVDELLASGVQPWATLFHWDYPLALYRKGGWMSPDSPKWFADYAKVVVDRLSDRVTNWMTLNEPQCFIGLGLQEGRHAPGDKLRYAEVLTAMHHTLLAHGLATQVIRGSAKKTPRVGWAPVGGVSMPATNDPKDVEVARRKMFSIEEKTVWGNTWWLDPVVFGTYPEDGIALAGDEMPKFTDEDMRTIRQPLDFFGFNTYHGQTYRAGANGEAELVEAEVGAPLTAFRWAVTPECLYWGAKFFHERYGLPIVVTENGLSNQDWVALDGKVHDPQRIDFLHRHLIGLKRASGEGVPIEGYFQWSLLDNFEWAEGYKERFGLVFVDYPTGNRIPKDSYYWYRDVIQSNGANL